MSERGELERLVLAALGDPCEECARAVVVMLEHVHEPQVLALAARAVGCSGTGQLSRHMRKHGSPPLEQLRDWLWFSTLAYEYQLRRRSLEQQA